MRGIEPRASPMRRERDTPTPHTQGTNVRHLIPHLRALFSHHMVKKVLNFDYSQNMKNERTSNIGDI